MPQLSAWSAPARWALLLACSLAIAGLFALLQLPAALFLGGMVGGVALAVAGGAVKPPPGLLELAQAVVGCLIARAFTPTVVAELGRDWPLFVAVVAATLLASAALAWGLGQGGRIPGSTAIWGMLPGGSITMMLMADEFGADGRLVAFMQNLRLVIVASFASAVAALAVPSAAPALAASGPVLPVAWPALAATLALALAAVVAARLWKGLPAGTMLLAMFGGGLLHGAGLMAIELPPWLLGPSFLLLGWAVGLRFTLATLKQAAQALPQVLGAIALLMAFCGAMAGALVWLAGVDPLTAYLATSPGGADSVAIIAAASPVDLPFVMTLQSMRVIAILVAGPAFARFFALRMREAEQKAVASGTERAHPLA